MSDHIDHPVQAGWLALAATSVLALWRGARFSVASYQQHYAPVEVGA
ncbi:hypothetical protein [Alkalimonas amylolytica]|nr:hypothetical protein [Alkalimonas amylolytica]